MPQVYGGVRRARRRGRATHRRWNAIYPAPSRPSAAPTRASAPTTSCASAAWRGMGWTGVSTGACSTPPGASDGGQQRGGLRVATGDARRYPRLAPGRRGDPPLWLQSAERVGLSRVARWPLRARHPASGAAIQGDRGCTPRASPPAHLGPAAEAAPAPDRSPSAAPLTDDRPLGRCANRRWRSRSTSAMNSVSGPTRPSSIAASGAPVPPR